MLCGITKDHRLLLRVENDQYEKKLKIKHAKVMDFTKKVMHGMINVEHDVPKLRVLLSSGFRKD